MFINIYLFLVKLLKDYIKYLNLKKSLMAYFVWCVSIDCCQSNDLS